MVLLVGSLLYQNREVLFQNAVLKTQLTEAHEALQSAQAQYNAQKEKIDQQKELLQDAGACIKQMQAQLEAALAIRKSAQAETLKYAREAAALQLKLSALKAQTDACADTGEIDIDVVLVLENDTNPDGTYCFSGKQLAS